MGLPKRLLTVVALAAMCACTQRKMPAEIPSRTNKIALERLKPGPVQPIPLSADQVARIERVRATLVEVDTKPLSRWLDNLSRDHHPDSEILIYEAIAKAYDSYRKSHATNAPENNEIYSLLLLRSMSTSEEALASVHLKHLTAQQAADVLAGYGLPPHPVTVQKTAEP